MSLAEIWRRLLRWRRRDRLGQELAEELQAHHDLLVRDFQQAGLPRGEAEAAARKQLGNLGRIRESSRDHWGFPVVDAVLRDLRHTARGLRKSPGFALTVILTLGLGIGANAVMFGVVDHLMFRPYRFLSEPSRVNRVYLRSIDRGNVSFNEVSEYTRYLDLRKWTNSFDKYAGFADRRIAVGVGDAARERPVGIVSADFWGFFDAPPALGRYFTPAEDQVPRGADVIVLGYELWQSEFGGRDVVGKTLQVENVQATIIGVAPKGFSGLSDNDAPALYIPITTYAGSQQLRRDRSDSTQALTYYTTYNWGWMSMMVRRKPGVSIEQASSDLSAAYLKSWNAERALDRLPPPEVAQPTAIASAMKTGAGPDPGLEARTALWVTGVAAVVLLIACANVANLYLARALKRRRETAVRVALGVSRGRLLAQCLVESLVLALLGSVTGLLIAQWGGTAVRRLFVEGSSLNMVTDWRTLGVATTLALVVGILTGLAPAVLSAQGDVATSLKAREGPRHRSRTRSVLMVAQVALSVVLLVGAALFVRSLDRVRGMRIGFDAEPVLLAQPHLRGVQLSDSEEIALGRQVLERGAVLPRVEHAAWVGSAPFYSTSGTSLYVAGIDSVRKLGRFTYQVATADYFATMDTRIVRGRPFTAADRAGTPRVVVVSESMAQVLWPGKDAIGQCIRVGADTMPCTAVIGIAEDAIQRNIVNDRRFHYYLPLEQFRPNEGITLLLRMKGDAVAQMEMVRRELQQLMPGLAYVTVRPLRDLVAAQRRSWQLGATMFVAFGGLALLVAAVGLYGVIAYNVAQRMHELGVRIALGAQAGDVMRLIVGQGVRFTLVGVSLGAGLALLGAHWLQPLLFQQSAKDPVVFAAVAVLLFLVALLASAAPARRAARADPNTALRTD